MPRRPRCCPKRARCPPLSRVHARRSKPRPGLRDRESPPKLPSTPRRRSRLDTIVSGYSCLHRKKDSIRSIAPETLSSCSFKGGHVLPSRKCRAFGCAKPAISTRAKGAGTARPGGANRRSSSFNPATGQRMPPLPCSARSYRFLSASWKRVPGRARRSPQVRTMASLSGMSRITPNACS